MGKFKKALLAGSVMIAVSAIGLTVAAATLVNKHDKNNNESAKQKKPKGREKYTHCYISSLIDCSGIKQSCLVFDDDGTLKFDRDEFKLIIKDAVRNAVGKLKKFSDSYQTLKYEVSYLIVNNQKILVDCVWYDNVNNPTKYYDQFSLAIKHE
jgi:hypothetical protein